MKTLCTLVILTGLGYSLLSLDPPVVKQAASSVPQAVSVQQIKKEEPPSEPPTSVKKPERKMYPAIGSASSESVTTAVEFYQSKGLTNVGVAYLVGNFVGESGLRPHAVGDGGKALGIAQWHPERRVGLPDTLHGQLEYAWREIQAYPLKGALYGTNESLLRAQIKRYEGYSVEGNRFVYAEQLLKELQ
jgi:hypothetical protein